MRTLGLAATAEKGWWLSHRFLMLRRISQILVLGLFLLGPVAGIWIIKGNLTSSLVLETVPLTDPFVLSQSLFAGLSDGSIPGNQALLAAAIVFGFYFLLGGRGYCSWVCPLNIVTDAAARIRYMTGIRGGRRPSRKTRYYLLAVISLLSIITGQMLWELVNPVSITHRSIIFGMGAVWILILGIFLFELLISPRGWCGHLCPAGAFYSLIGYFSPVRISAVNRKNCDDCGDCYQVCPEAQVIKPALKNPDGNQSPIILSPNCTNCGRCIDICSKDVFKFRIRYGNTTETQL